MRNDWTIPQGITEITKDYIQENMPRGTTRVIIPAGVTSIGVAAFYDCTGLTQIVIPAGVTSIGDGAFCDCTGLTQINLPAGVTSIGDGAFGDCTGLTQINLPAGVTSIGDGAFSGCTGLAQINLPEGVTSIKSWAFQNCTGLTQIVIPAGVTSIGTCAFSGCTGLTQIVIPEGVTSIENGAFLGCEGLTQMVIPAGVTSIGRSAFLNCTGLTQLILPDQFCTDAEKVRLCIPEAVRCIGYGEIQSFINDDLNIEGAYSADKQALLYRLSSDGTFHPDELKGLKDCSFNDVMKAIQSRYTTLGADGDIRGLMKGLFGASRIDQTVEIGQLMELDFAEIVSLGADRSSPSELLSYMTVKDMMKNSKSERGGSGLSSQSLFQPKEASGNGPEQAVGSKGSRP